VINLRKYHQRAGIIQTAEYTKGRIRRLGGVSISPLPVKGGTYKPRNEKRNAAKRNQTQRNEIKVNEKKTNDTQLKLKESKGNGR
jgi:hypothetical protein